MPGTTPVYGFPYPEPTDLVADYPALGQQLAEDIEDVLPTIGGMSIIASQSFSAVSSISLNNCFSATYEHYRCMLFCDNSTGAQSLRWQMRASGVNAGTNYAWSAVNIDGATIAGSSATAQSSGYLGYIDTNGTWLAWDIYRPFVAARTQWFSTTGWNVTAPKIRLHAGTHDNAASYDGFTLLPTSGTITGTVRVYAYRDSV